MRKTYLFLLAVFTIFCIWMIGYVVVASPMLLPDPYTVFKAFIGIFGSWSSLSSILMTIMRLVIALLVAFLVGGILGTLAGFHKNFSVFMQPFVAILRTIPVISVIVIILIFFGFKISPYVITFLMIFPLIYQTFHDGITDIDQELVDVYRLEDNHWFTGMRYCYLPLIKNQITTVLLQSAGLGIKVLVMSEYLSQTRNSIGNSLYLAKINLAYDQVFAWTLILILMTISIELVINHFKNREQKIIIENKTARTKLD
ncbi:MAG TPA: ABC transporter permease subunit [Candidatus Izemoplasmatales bacterium]|nr:ABC transporter permease subunit [Candidatus Izemoplasmatales bacterium]